MLIKLNMSPRNAFLHALCIYHIPYMYTIYHLNVGNNNQPKTKSTIRLGTGKIGENGKEKGKWKTPIYALMPDQQMFFHYFRLFSPFITCSRQRQFSLLGQVNHNNTAPTPKLQMKPRASRVGGGGPGGGRGRANNTTCKTKGSSLPHLNNLSNRHHNCSPSIGQKLAGL